MSSSDIDIAHRNQWPRLLMAVPATQVHAVVKSLAPRLVVEDMQLAQSGLGLLQLRDGALGEAYFPGEIPLARARVRVTDQTGARCEGAALLMDDRASLARAIAILDAVLAGGLDGNDEVAPLLTEGARFIQRQQSERKAMLAATKVNFSLMGAEDETEDENEY